jgi:hypothetical protein
MMDLNAASAIPPASSPTSDGSNRASPTVYLSLPTEMTCRGSSDVMQESKQRVHQPQKCSSGIIKLQS